MEDEDIEVEADEAVRIVLELARSAMVGDDNPLERARQEKAIEFIEDYCDSLL